MTQRSNEELQYLRICGACYALCETGRPDAMDQRCHCTPRDEKPWPGFDFNERASLCQCCALEALPSGSRWSPYFCPECQLLAMGASIVSRRLLFPIGRHSLMHTWLPVHGSPTLDAHGDASLRLAETVQGQIMSIASATDGLRQWSAIIVSRHLRQLGLPGGTYLTDYLAAVPRIEITRWAVFDELCQFVGVSGDRPSK